MIQKIFLMTCAILFNVTSSFAMHDDFVYLDEVEKLLLDPYVTLERITF